MFRFSSIVEWIENDAYYTCEVIRKDAKEYPIWEQFCTQNFKSSTRKYGIM